jgi:hypothetical protein
VASIRPIPGALGILHLGEEMMLFELLVALLEIIHVVFTADETQMRHLTNEEIWRRDNALFHEKRPKLLGDLE